MLCKKCGSDIKENINFCGKCGTKIDKEESPSANVEKSSNSNNIDGFIGDKSNKTDKQSVDSDVFTKIDKTNNKYAYESKIDDNNKNYGKKKGSLFNKLLTVFNKPKASKKVKSSSKSKQKKNIKVKQKPKVKTKSVNKQKKKTTSTGKKGFNKILILLIILAPIIIVAAVFLFFLLRGKPLNPSNDVAKAFKATFDQIAKYEEKAKELPDFSINKTEASSDDKNKEAKIFEKEQYLKIKNAKGGLINEDILGSLKGLSFKINEKQDIENDLFSDKLTLSNEKNEEIFAEISSSKESVVLKLPNLYNSNLAMHFINEDKTEGDKTKGEDGGKEDSTTTQAVTSNPYYNDVKQLLDILKNGESSFISLKNTVKDKSFILINDIVKNAKFTLLSENEQSFEKEYSTNIDNIALLESLKAFITEIKEDDFNNKLQLLFSNLLNGDSLKLAEFLTVGSPDMLITSIDNTIKILSPEENTEEVQEKKGAGISLGEIVGDTAKQMANWTEKDVEQVAQIDIPKETEIRLLVNQNGTISDVSFSIVIDGTLISVNINIEELENKLSLNTSLKISKGDSNISIDLVSINEQSSSDEIKRGNTISITSLLDDKIVLDSYDIYNLKSNVYKSKYDFSIIEGSEEFIFNLDLSAKYKEENESSRLDIDSLKVNINDGLYNFDLEFVGHIIKNMTSSIELMNSSSAIFIDNMTKEETDIIIKEINNNWNKFLDKFRRKEW